MVMFIVNGWAHRMLNNGLVESSPVKVVPGEDPKDTAFIVKGPWALRTQESMGMSGGDSEYIRAELSRMDLVFANLDRVPKNMRVQHIQPNPVGPRP